MENISLLPNGRETAFVGVNLYCDDQAQIKGLELNPRASQMAQCCGKMIEVGCVPSGMNIRSKRGRGQRATGQAAERA